MCNDEIKTEENNFWHEADVISTYSRANAIEDGLLVLVDEKLSKEAGFKFPVAICRSVWEKYVDWTDTDTKRQTYQDLTGRLWDMLYMLMFTIKASQGSNDKLRFPLYVVPRSLKSKAKRPKQIYLWSHIHPGDQLEPVITISEEKYLD